MQYGNLFSAPEKSLEAICLNRTMQYGNLNRYFLSEAQLIQFKSYYVVWKPKWKTR